MTSSKHAQERKAATRLRRAGQKVDILVARVRDATGRVTGRVARQVDALRAHEAHVHTRLREMREADEAAWAGHGAELDRELDELEAQLTIAERRLQAECASDRAAFAAAVAAELVAWGTYLQSVKARRVLLEARALVRWEAAVHALETHLVESCRATRSAQDVPSVRQCLAALDRAADELASIRGAVT